MCVVRANLCATQCHGAIIPTLAQWPRLNPGFDPPPNLSLRRVGARLCLPARIYLVFFLSPLSVCFLAAPPLWSWQLKSALELLNTEAGRIRPFNACHGRRLYQWLFLSPLHWCQWRSSKTARMRQKIFLVAVVVFPVSSCTLNTHACSRTCNTHTNIHTNGKLEHMLLV